MELGRLRYLYQVKVTFMSNFHYIISGILVNDVIPTLLVTLLLHSYLHSDSNIIDVNVKATT